MLKQVGRVFIYCDTTGLGQFHAISTTTQQSNSADIYFARGLGIIARITNSNHSIWSDIT
jgi:hypothetical protein